MPLVAFDELGSGQCEKRFLREVIGLGRVGTQKSDVPPNARLVLSYKVGKIGRRRIRVRDGPVCRGFSSMAVMLVEVRARVEKGSKFRVRTTEPNSAEGIGTCFAHLPAP